MRIAAIDIGTNSLHMIVVRVRPDLSFEVIDREKEMVRLGADIRTDGHHAVIRGRHWLSGAPVRATDIRAGAGLVMAGLVADGITTVSDAFHVDRGYPGFLEQLRALGADVSREPDPDQFPA